MGGPQRDCGGPAGRRGFHRPGIHPRREVRIPPCLFSRNPNPSRLMEGWGTPYRVMRTSIKPHACCRYKQGPIDGILEIMNKHRLKASDIQEVSLGILKAGFPIVADPEEHKYNPKSVVDAQFSMPFGAAVAVLYGRASLNEYTQEKVESSEVREMMRRIHCVKDPELDKDFPKRWPASVTILTRSRTAVPDTHRSPQGRPGKSPDLGGTHPEVQRSDRPGLRGICNRPDCGSCQKAGGRAGSGEAVEAFGR